MGKVPQNVAFCVLIVLTLNVCVMEPMGFETFLEDPKVIEIIEKGLEKVNITADSDQGLKGEKNKITGLDPNKYYIVEEWDENGVLIGVQFVSAAGTRTTSLTGIGRVIGTEITGLTNNNNYRVKSAKPLNGQVTYYDQATIPTPGTGTIENISDGALTFKQPNDKYYLDLPALITTSYDKVKFLLPGNSASPVTPVSGNIIKLEGKGTKTDYVFAGKNANGGINPAEFYVLRVTVNQPTNVNVTVTFIPPVDEGKILSMGSVKISRAVLLADPPANNKVTIIVTGLAGFTNTQILIGTKTVTGNSVVIGYNGTPVDTDNIPDIDDLLIEGNTIVITVRATKTSDSKVYSNVLLVTIDP